MRQLTAAQLPEGGWKFVSRGASATEPIGYCVVHAPHHNELEARICFAAWLRDHLDLNASRLPAAEPCDVCGADTVRSAVVANNPYYQARLCPEHMTFADATAALGLDNPAADVWIS